jgi:hypothetical protein
MKKLLLLIFLLPLLFGAGPVGSGGPIDGIGGIGITALPVPVNQGGTGAATLTDHGLLLGSGVNPVTSLGAATNGQIPIGSTGADPILSTITGTANEIDVTNAAGSITIGIVDPLIVGKGGTGVATLNDGGLVVGNGAAAVEVVAPGLTTEILVGGGLATNPVWTTATGTGAPVRAISPALTSVPTAPTAVAGTNNTQIATTAYADAKVADAIADGVTTIAPSENAVFDALALKAPLVHPETALASSNAINLSIANVSGKMINNYGQIALNDNITYTLPAAAADYAFTFIAGETVAKFVRFDANAADFIYLDGVVGDGAGEYIGVASVAIGNSISCRTAITAAANYDWFCVTIAGAWVKE